MSQHKLYNNRRLHHPLNLKEPLQPPNLKHSLRDQDPQLEDTPPLDPRIRTLRRIPMHALPHHNVTLLIFHLIQQFRQLTHLPLKRILMRLALRHVYNPVYIEGDIFVACGPVFVAEAIHEFPVHGRVEAMVAAADGLLVDLMAVGGVHYLLLNRVSVFRVKDLGLCRDWEACVCVPRSLCRGCRHLCRLRDRRLGMLLSSCRRCARSRGSILANGVPG